jgi:hypothetical protein
MNKTQQLSTPRKNYERFNTDEINLMSIRSFLESQGYERVGGNSSVGIYHAKWRGDENPSLRVYYNINRWFDYGGKGIGGGIIDLVKEMYKVGFVDACKMLCNGNIPRVEKTSVAAETKQKIRVFDTRPVIDSTLKSYLASRGIDDATTADYLSEIRYSVNDRTYFGLGFKNDFGGYEIRTEKFKGCTSKDITTIEKSLPNCNVFEGFFDFLSYESLSKRNPRQYPPASAIVLNSVSVGLGKKRIGRVIDFLKKHKTVNCYFDHDETGKQAFVYLKEMIGTSCEINDCSQSYVGYNDFNEFAVNNQKISQTRGKRM